MYNISFQIWLFWVSMINFRGYYFVISGFWRQAALLRACWQKLQSCQTPSLGEKKMRPAMAPHDAQTKKSNRRRFLALKSINPRWFNAVLIQICGPNYRLPDSVLWGTIAIRVRGSTLQPSALCCLWPITESISQSKAQIDSRPLQFWEDLS